MASGNDKLHISLVSNSIHKCEDTYISRGCYSHNLVCTVVLRQQIQRFLQKC